MRGKWFVWLVAALIGSALAFPSMSFAATKEKKAAQPCAPAMKEEKAKTKMEAKGAKTPAKKAAKKAAKKKAAAEKDKSTK